MILKTFIDSINSGKNTEAKGQIKISSKADIVDVKPLIKKTHEKTDTKTGNHEAVIFFEYTTVYKLKDKDIAGIKIRGRVIYEDGPEDIIEAWKKEKKIPKKLIVPILNNILAKASVTALVITTHINLPPPFQLPNVQIKESGASYID